jgi:hypothetical protein
MPFDIASRTASTSGQTLGGLDGSPTRPIRWHANGYTRPSASRRLCVVDTAFSHRGVDVVERGLGDFCIWRQCRIQAFAVLPETEMILSGETSRDPRMVCIGRGALGRRVGMTHHG